MIRVFNTLTRDKQPLPDQKKLRLFVCGPTVYDYAHIGHARTYLFFDFFTKYLRSQGYDVMYLQNITDVDDKIIKRAAEESKKPEDLSKHFSQSYIEDMAALGITGVNEYAPATKFIAQIIAQVQRLIDKEYAYKIEGDGWYFDITKFPDYGKLSGRTAAQAEDAVSRIDEAADKRNKGDFCLWKFSKAGEPVWTAPIGNGRPGWHIEDTAISEFYFGPQYEIHGGGVDIKFPHHEAEIAQQESASGKKPFVQFWMHVGSLLVDGKKMSKSLGNFVTIRDFLTQHSPDTLRWIVFTHQYRSPVDYSTAAVQQADAAIETLQSFWGKLIFLEQSGAANAFTFDTATVVDKLDAEFAEALADDANTPAALAALFNMVSAIQSKVWTLDAEAATTIRMSLESKLALFGITFTVPKTPANVTKLVADRELSRGSKDFAQSDALRQQINALGFDVEDTPKGPFLWPQPKKHN